MSHVVLTAQNFEAEVTKSKLPVVVDASADWCGPCVAMKPVVKAAAEELKGVVKFGLLDIDAENAVAQKLSVMSVPTFIVYKNKKEVGRFMGSMNREKFLARIRELVG